MAASTRFVKMNGEIAENSFEWSHHPKSVWWFQAGPLGLMGAAVFGGIAGAIADAEDSSVVLWAIVGAVLGALLVGGIAYYSSASRLELKKSVLKVSTGQKKVNIPMGAIAYIGKAEFSKANKWRMSKMNTVVEAGPGIEIVSRDRKYITASTTHADAVFQALLQQGMHPDTLRVPFPAEAVSAKPPAHREQR